MEDRWWDVTCGVAQGCPFSPVLAATVMAAWAHFVEETASPGAERLQL